MRPGAAGNLRILFAPDSSVGIPPARPQTLLVARTSSIVVTPATSLHNNEAVHVSGTGFKPHDSVYITECLATAKGEAGCDINVVVPATINAKGVLAKTTFNVATGTIGNGKCGTTAANLRKCAVSVGNASGGDSATFVVTFALPKKK